MAELTKINDQKVALIKEYASQWGTITDDQASSLIKRALAVDEQHLQARRGVAPEVALVEPSAVGRDVVQRGAGATDHGPGTPSSAAGRG